MKYNMEGKELVKVNTNFESTEESNPSCVAVNSQGIIYVTDLTSSYKKPGGETWVVYVLQLLRGQKHLSVGQIWPVGT